MKIGMVHLNLAVESGDPRMFYSIAQGIKTRGHEVAVYTARFDLLCFPGLNRGLNIVVGESSGGAEGTPRGQSLLAAIKSRWSKDRFQKEGVAAIKAKLRPDLDVLVCQNDLSYVLGEYYKRVRPSTRVVWIMNNAPFYSERKANFWMTLASRLNAFREKRQVKRKLKGIDIIVVHDEERGKLARSLGKPTVVLSIPVDFESFYQPVKRRLAGDRSFTLLGIGSLSPTRKFEDIIQATAGLCAAGYDANAILVCKDVRQDSGYKSMLLSLVKATGLENKVRFYFDGAGESELRAIQSAADCFVFPNHFNIWSMAAFESMAAGLPLLTSRITSVAEVLREGEEALFFEPGRADQIAAAARSLIDNPEDYARIGAAGQRFVQENLNWEKYVDRFLSTAVGAPP